MSRRDAFLLADLAATEELARDVVARTKAGDLLVLTGPLGAGKTTLTQALARQFGSTATVTSPTYTLVHEYPTPAGPLVHVDAYRLGDARDVEFLGLDDYLERSRLVVVEWGAGLLGAYPAALWLELGFASAGTNGTSGAAGTVGAAGTEPDRGASLAGDARTARWRSAADYDAGTPPIAGSRP